MNNAAEILQSFIQKACDFNISRLKVSAKFKSWWNSELNLMRKKMTKAKRYYQEIKFNSEFEFEISNAWNQFKIKRLNYFHAIRQVKSISWIEFLKNAKEKEIFKAYKFTKSNLVEKIPAIQFDNQLNITFDQESKAFIKAMYLQ